MAQRKVHIFIFSVLVAVIARYTMPIDYYDKFLYFLLFLAISFFSANGIEHLANGLKKPPAVLPPTLGDKDE